MNMDLRSFLESFNRSRNASFVTNGGGFILEVNQAAADMFKSTIQNLKNKGLITFGSRKKGCDALRAVKDSALNLGKASMTKVAMRPRGDTSFRVNLTAEVLSRSEMLVLIHWNLIDADLNVIVSESSVNAAE